MPLRDWAKRGRADLFCHSSYPQCLIPDPYLSRRALHTTASAPKPKARQPKEGQLTLIRPFRALRPVPGRAREVLAPPYDVLSSAEARQRARGKLWSFLHVSKPEIDLPEGTDPYSSAVYAKAAENLERMVAERVLVRDARPHYYAYRTVWQGRRQTGLACLASLAGYENGRVRRHELTTPVKETDRVRQIEAINAQTGPVMMAYPHAPEIDTLLKRATERDPDIAVTADDDVTHELWVIADNAPIEELTAAFDGLPALYIADGHHRSAAAARVSAARGGVEGSHRYFLSVVFPHHSMVILDYNRVVRDLGGRTPEAFLAAVGERFAVTAGADAGAAHGGARLRHVPRRQLVPAEARGEPGARGRRGGPASRDAARPQPDRAGARHRRPAHRQTHRLRRRRARPRPSWRAAWTPARWRWPSRSIRRRWRT